MWPQGLEIKKINTKKGFSYQEMVHCTGSNFSRCARGFSCAVSGFGQVFFSELFFSQLCCLWVQACHQKVSPPSTIKTSGTQGKSTENWQR